MKNGYQLELPRYSNKGIAEFWMMRGGPLVDVSASYSGGKLLTEYNCFSLVLWVWLFSFHSLRKTCLLTVYICLAVAKHFRIAIAS